MMKQKKIIVPILTLAVMLLMVGGVYAVFSSTQPEKSKAENVRDTTDQDYEKGLTEEQKAFNELINKQIYEETANNLEQYEQYGFFFHSHSLRIADGLFSPACLPGSLFKRNDRCDRGKCLIFLLRHT